MELLARILLTVGAAAWLVSLLITEVRVRRATPAVAYEGAVAVMPLHRRLTLALGLPGALLVLAGGVLLLRETDLSLTGDWFTGALLGLWVVAFVGSTMLRASECRNITRLAAAATTEDEHEDVRWRTRRITLLARGELFLLAVGVALAIIQPS